MQSFPRVSAGCWLRTLRHVRPVQVTNRLWRRLHRPAPDVRPPPPLRAWPSALPVGAPPKPAWNGGDAFTFLNRTAPVRAAADWDDPARTLLWRYQLHSFDYLPRESGLVPESRALIEAWIRDNPPAKGTGWDPYPLSRRIARWVQWAAWQNLRPSGFAESLAVQTHYLRPRLEHHLLANHLFVNAKALFFAGCFFGGGEGDAWAGEGIKWLLRELPEQFLDDGAQFERAPMYHALLLEDLLDLLAVARAADLENTAPALAPSARRLRAELERRIPPALEWLRALEHPDGGIALFNDSALGQAPSRAALGDYAACLGFAVPPPPPPGLRVLAPSGFFRFANARYVALGTIGGPAPWYQPGHAHADTLGFELSIGGRRALVDTGVSTYTEFPHRQDERATGAHNTLSVDGADSSEVWAFHRVGRRARAELIETQKDGDAPSLAAAHGGFAHLSGVGRHIRRWAFAPNELRIEDTVEGDGLHDVAVWFHAHPQFAFKLAEHGAELAPASGGAPICRVQWPATLRAEIVSGHYAPEFGLREANAALVLRARVNLPFSCNVTLQMA